MPDRRQNGSGCFERGRWFFVISSLVVGGFLCPPATSTFASEPPDAFSETRSALAQITGPVVETVVVGLTLRGERHRDQLRIPDLDVIYTEDGKHLLPLLRILDILTIEMTHSGTSLMFRPEGAAEAVVDFETKSVTSGTQSRTVAIRVGVSDITRSPEVYVPADVLGELLGLDIQWDEQAYEFVFYTDQRLRVFEQFYPSTPSLFTIGTHPAEIHLPGNLPPARVKRLSAPDLNFAEVQMQTRAYSSETYGKQVDRFKLPHLKLWGQVLGGNLVTSISQKRYVSSNNISFDQASWTTWFDHSEISMGSSHFGISDLVFPSVDLLGVRLNGLLRARGGQSEDPTTGSARQQSFLPTHVFQGYAPLETSVTLFINDREISSQTVEPFESASPGMGLYRFEGVNLLTRQLNEIRIVSTLPDGSIEETTREVLGTNLLLPEGAVSYLGGTGTGRRGLGDHWETDGAFAGGRMFYGLRSNFSVGISGAFQEHLSTMRVNSFAIYDQDLSWVPSRSLHLGPRFVWQPTGRLLVNGEAARSHDSDGSASGWAYKLGADYQHRSFSIRPSLFWYSPVFFDGRNVLLRDRAGGNLNASWRLGTGQRAGIVVTHIQDNLYDTLDETMSLKIAHAYWTTRALIPKSSFTFGGTRLWSSSLPAQEIWTVGLDTALLPKWNLRSSVQLGNDFQLGRREDTLRGQGLGQSGAIGPRTSRIELARRLGRTWRLSFGHRRSSNLDRSFLDITRRRIGGRSWQWRSSLGFDWQQKDPFIDNRLEYTLDASQRNRILLESRYYRESWVFNVWLQIRGLFGFVERRPFWVGDAHLNPAGGGVKGKVFLDFNANGLLDSGEPGLEAIDIVSNAGSSASSGRNGQFVLSSSARTQRVRVRLEPETLPAIYTPTQAVQDAFIKPGLYTEVNLGVAAFGSISSNISVPSEKTGLRGIWGVKVLLVDANGKVVGNSITNRDGSYYLGEVKPGTYTVMLDKKTFPADYEMDIVAREVEVLSGVEPFDVDDLSFLGEYRGQPIEEIEEVEEEDVQYKVFD